MAMINEAPAWAMNNCQFVAWWTAAEVGLPINGAAVAVAVHAAVDIAPGEELLYDYGSDYWDALTPLSRPLHAVVPRDGTLYKLNARLNPRRAAIDWF